MVSIITRVGKGTPLTHDEMDTNLTNIKTAVEGTSGRYAAAVLADNPVAYWPFNDEYGATQYLDSSGNGYHLTASGVMVPVRGGVVGDNGRGMYSYGGSTSSPGGCARIPAALGSVFPASTGFTIEGLVRVELRSLGAYSALFCIGTTASNLYSEVRLCLLNNSVLRPYGAVGTTTNTNVTVSTPGAAPLAVGSWVHLAMVCDTKSISIYMDGVRISQIVQACVPLAGARTLGGVFCSQYTDSGQAADQPPSAAVDELALYNTALSADRILLHARIAAGWAT